MPELPEVHTFQQYLNETTVGKPIVEVEVHDEKIIRNVDGETFRAELTNRTVQRTSRIGKYAFLHLDNGKVVQFHFGMTGDLHFYGPDEERPRFERFNFVFDDGCRLGYCCSRKFSRILCLDNLDDYLAEIGLGKDALDVTEAEFLTLTEGRTTRIKAFLLDQSKVAGIGNLYADEICFQTQIHPASTLSALSRKQKKAIWKVMHDILHEAVSVLPNYYTYPDNWYWEKWRHVGGKGPQNSIVTVTKVAGRTTYFCEGYQKLYE